MLRDLPPYLETEDSHVFMTGAPDTAHEVEEQTTVDPLDDVFGSTPASPALNGQDDAAGHLHQARSSAADPSDIPRLRSLHITNGYREGIAVSKEKHMQEGFDEGYSLGAEIGLKAGWCLGALEGVWHALSTSTQPTPADGAGGDSVDIPSRESVQQMLREAEEELQMQRMFGKEYFGEDGIWLYDVPGHEGGDDESTFEQIAEAHPALRRWTEKVLALSHEVGLRLQ